MKQRQNVISHFDRYADGGKWSKLYDEDSNAISNHSFIIRKRRVEELLTQIVAPKMQVLDVGCGTGIMAPYFVERDCEYHGIDISETMIEQAKSNPRLNQQQSPSFALGDVTKLQFPNHYFEVVIALGLLEYLDELDAAVQEIIRVTKQDGCIILTVPNRLCVDYWADRLLSPCITGLYHLVKRLRGNPTVPYLIRHRRFSPRELKFLLEKYGCNRTGYAYYDLEMFFYPLRKIVPRFSLRVKAKAEEYSHTLLRWFATGYICRFRKSGDSLL